MGRASAWLGSSGISQRSRLRPQALRLGAVVPGTAPCWLVTPAVPGARGFWRSLFSLVESHWGAWRPPGGIGDIPSSLLGPEWQP